LDTRIPIARSRTLTTPTDGGDDVYGGVDGDGGDPDDATFSALPHRSKMSNSNSTTASLSPERIVFQTQIPSDAQTLWHSPLPIPGQNLIGYPSIPHEELPPLRDRNRLR
jgi:hypothetical protein